MSITNYTPLDRGYTTDPNGRKVDEDISSVWKEDDWFGWGSYSGADIKVVVHLPRDWTAEETMLNERAQLEKELQELTGPATFTNNNPKQRTIDAEPSQVYSQDYVYKTDKAHSALVYRIAEIDEEIRKRRSIPSSKVLGELQTISYSIFREKTPVRTLGSVYPRGFVRGPRTIAGSMVFTVFHKHVLSDILALNLKFYNTGTSDHDKYLYTSNLPDQLPPLDISLVFANEYGSVSHMGIWGVEFVQEGVTFSIEDIFTENVVQYVARDLDPMRVVDKREVDGHGIREEWSTTASQLNRDKNFEEDVNIRRNQFI